MRDSRCGALRRPLKSRATRRPNADRTALYQDITNDIIATLETGRVPWAQLGTGARAPLDIPDNASTREASSGLSVINLWGKSPRQRLFDRCLLTCRQARVIGDHIRKDERGRKVVEQFTREQRDVRCQVVSYSSSGCSRPSPPRVEDGASCRPARPPCIRVPAARNERMPSSRHAVWRTWAARRRSGACR